MKKNILSLPTKKAVLVLSVPMIISNLLSTLYELIDAFFVGKTGVNNLAAVTLAGIVLFFLATFGAGLSVGTVALISRSFGEKKFQQANFVAYQSILLGFIVAVILGFTGFIFSNKILQLLSAPANILTNGTIYLKILFLGIPGMFFLFIGNAIFQAAGDTKTPLFVNIFATLLNILGDWVLIFGHWGFPAMGVKGAALATISSRFLGSLILLLLLLDKKKIIHLRISTLKPNFNILGTIIRIGFPASIQMFIRSSSALVLMKIVALFGSFTIAAYGIGGRIFSLFILPGFGFAGAASTLVGQNLGAKRPEEAERSVYISTFYFEIVIFILSAITFFFSPKIVSIFNNNKDVVLLGGTYLKFISIGALFLPIGVVFSRGMQGAGDAITPMVITAIVLYGIQIPLAYVLSHFFAQNGIWSVNAIGSFMQSILIYIIFKQGKWKNKKLIHLNNNPLFEAESATEAIAESTEIL